MKTIAIITTCLTCVGYALYPVLVMACHAVTVLNVALK